MSENESGGAAPDQVSDSSQVPNDKAASGSVEPSDAWRTKILGEKKKVQKERDDLRDKLYQLEQDKLSAEGKKDELIQHQRSQIDDLNGKLKSAIGNFATGNAKQIIAQEASKLGCNDIGLLTKAIEDKLGDIDYDDAFNPNSDQVRMLLDGAKDSHPLLFSKSAPTVANHQLNPGSISTGQKSVKELSKEELAEKLAQELAKR